MKEKKSVTVDARMIEISGVGTYLQNLLPRLISAPFHWRAIVPSGALDRFSWLKNIDCIPLDTRFYSIREQVDLPKLIPRSDIFWSPNFNIPLLPIRARKRLVTIHDVNHLAFSSQLGRWEKIFVKALLLRAVSMSTQVITDSLFSQAEIEKHLGPASQKIKMIPLGVDSKIFTSHGKKDHLVSEKYKLPKDFVLFIGNVKPHKNLPKLLLAFKKRADLGHHLVVVGRKEQAERGDDLTVLLKENPILKERVHFLGIIPSEDLPPLYRLAKAFVMPSLYEGFGLPVLEAMRCRCPVLVANRASLPEVAGSHAVYINPDDVEDIAQGLEEVLIRGNQLKESGFAWAENFSWDKTAQKHLEILETL